MKFDAKKEIRFFKTCKCKRTEQADFIGFTAVIARE